MHSVHTCTVPCDGFIYIFVNPKTTATEQVQITGSSFSTIQCSAVNGIASNAFGLCRKGDTLKITATTGLESNSVANFIPLHD